MPTRPAQAGLSFFPCTYNPAVSRRAGIDTGGTFTDFVRLSRSGLAVHKVRSTPDDPSRAILAGLAELDTGRPATEVVHG